MEKKIIPTKPNDTKGRVTTPPPQPKPNTGRINNPPPKPTKPK
jgi:hypothetical protein